MIPAQPTTPLSAPRILFVCEADTTAAVSALEACHHLCTALASEGVQPVVLQNWSASAQSETRQAAKVQERPYPMYCSRNVRLEATLLSLVEQPTLAITLGTDPVGLAQPLLDSGLPCIAWFVDASGFHSIPDGELDRRLGLAAASDALARQLSALAGAPVSSLLPPISHHLQLSNGGDAVLIPSLRRIDGIQRVLQMARARPHIPFVAVGHTRSDSAEPSLPTGRPANLTVLDSGHAMRTNFRMAVLPSLSADLPWDRLAQCLAARLPVLVSSEPLLEDSIGDAGMVVPVSQPLEAWLDALDLMHDDTAHTAMAQSSVERVNGLRLPAQQAAQACAQLAARHVRSLRQPLTGRI